MAVCPKQRYPNEAKRANYDIYDDFKLKNNISSLVYGLCTHILALQPFQA